MARLSNILILACLVLGPFSLRAEDGSPQAPEETPPRPPHQGDPAFIPPPPFERDLKKLSLKEKRHFDKNRKNWENLSPEEKEQFRKKRRDIRKRVAEHIDQLIERLELKVNAEQKEAFIKRYFEERRKIERELFEKMKQERDQRLKALDEKLKIEFSNSAEKVTKETPEDS
ncbi:MAG: hypothetical protein ACK5LK_04040 [Chthoniobacterales bacterium]